MAPTESTADELWMERALGLAEASIGLASPNPVTGCVLVKNGNVIGEGFHSYADKDHAEIVALKQAGAEARGATAYVTLEPCSHHGRTPPCADALIKAGVARVVTAARDPNPQVSGRGLDRLQAAGVSLTIGVKEAAARRLNEAFAKFIRTHRPFVTLKAGMTLDGRIAPPPTKDHIPSGSTHWITGDRSREVVQELRHAADAILTGIGTILNDDPLLTDRSGRQRRRPFLRVVLDSSLRLSVDSQLVRTASQDVLVFHTQPSARQAKALEERGVRVERLDPDPATGRVPLRAVMERLADMEMLSVMLEGGSQINASALAAQIVDKLYLFYAPAIYGDAAVPVVRSLEPNTYFATRLGSYQLHELGEDFAVEGYLHNPWESA
ncbi:MAG TPA: bifunctional diaminohydroxyphosphoribosylaminopyrimidine deaminase/5-amino-6-(5-phosphoribosylamino)uracil reductase RibD [Acidobacteriaceae bacterium]|nr:bifunctional diaminohydroxyphosphoribosylaminopyrimidine deaminase/5-amino-6-(5-phosphoribosylamino)uracil reductase RibD [Acidobacteriaceae bacterium]